MKTNRMVFLSVAAFVLGAALAACSPRTAPTAPATPVGISGLWMGSTLLPGSSLVPLVASLVDSAPADTAAALSGTGTFGETGVSITGHRNGSTLQLRVSADGQQFDVVGQFSGGVFLGTASGAWFTTPESVYLERTP